MTDSLLENGPRAGLPRAGFLGLGLALAAGLITALPSLFSGFFLDDLAQIALMEPWYPRNAGTFNLYSFLGELPLDPWWKHPDFQVALWRPLSSALLRVDQRLFGHDSIGYHAHSLLWLACLLALVAAFYRKRLSPRVATLALLIFALDECHILTAGWIANRHAMVAMVPTVLGLMAHLRWRQEGWSLGLPLSLLGYAVGMAASEASLGIMAYVVAFEVFGQARRLRDLWRGLTPVAVLGVAYVLAYKAMGFGAARSGFYLDPLRETQEFFLGALGHIPAFLSAAVFGLPSDLWFFAPEMRPIQIGVGVLAALLLAFLVTKLWPTIGDENKAVLRWIAPGALLSLLPSAISQPFDRNLLAPMLGGGVVLAVIVTELWAVGRGSSARSFVRAGALGLATLLVLIHLLLAPVGRIGTFRFMGDEWRDLRRLAARLPADVLPGDEADVVFLAAPDIVIGGFLPLVHGFEGQPCFHSWEVLSLAPYDYEIVRTDARTLEMRMLERQMLTSPPERFHRPSSTPLRRGDVIRTADLEVEVLEDNGLGPVRVTFRFARSLDSGPWRFLAWTEEGVESVGIPEIGETRRYPYVPGPLEAALSNLSPL